MIVLASGSKVRATLLGNAGVPFEAVSPGVDEAAVKAELVGMDPHGIAGELAVRKAQAVSRRRRGDIVIGADQTMELDGRLYDKAESLTGARERLLALRGRTHALNAGVALARGGQVLWRETAVSRLTVRDVSEAWIDDYLSRNPQVLSSVACYELEGEGVQLFEKIDGDFFAVLGLPLVPLLTQLRGLGALPS